MQIPTPAKELVRRLFKGFLNLDKVVTTDETQTIKDKTLNTCTINTSVINTPYIATPNIVFSEVQVNFNGGHNSFIFTETDFVPNILHLTNSDDDVQLLATEDGGFLGRVIIVKNETQHNATIHYTLSGSSGATVAAGKTAIVMFSSTDYDFVRVTADA